MVLWQKWWDNHTKTCYIANNRSIWKHNGTRPKIHFHHNGAKRKNGDTCFDMTLIVGYMVFSYTNYDLQNKMK